MCEQNASYLVRHTELESQNLPENYSKRTKIAITARKFLKIFGGSMPSDPLELFLLLNQFQLCSAEKKIRLKKNLEIMAPLF